MRFVAGVMSVFLGVYMSTFIRMVNGWVLRLPTDAGGHSIRLPVFLVFIPIAYGVYSLVMGEIEVIRDRRLSKQKTE